MYYSRSSEREERSVFAEYMFTVPCTFVSSTEGTSVFYMLCRYGVVCIVQEEWEGGAFCIAGVSENIRVFTLRNLCCNGPISKL